MISNIIITVQGPEESGKKHVIAAMKRALEQYGMTISVLGGDRHLEGTQNLSEEELKSKLSTLPILIIEQNTGPSLKEILLQGK